MPANRLSVGLRTTLTIFVVSLLASGTRVGAQERLFGDIVSHAKLAGLVSDSTNAPIPNATVVLHWNRPSPYQRYSQLLPSQMMLGDIRLKTNLRGEFSASLGPGFYDVTVILQGCDPETHKLVEVLDNKTVYQMFWLIPSTPPKP
jgi:hypothetical protein